MENQVETPNKSYKSLFYGLLTVLLMAASFGAGIWYQSNQSPKKEEDNTKITVTVEPSIKPSITTKAGPTIKAEPTTHGLSAQEENLPLIKAAMAQKYDRPVSEVNMEIGKYEPSFAQGTVSFGDEMSGGWFLAAEVGGKWVIVDDGNGTISCDIIEPYNFPITIVAECWDEATQDIVYR